MRPEPSPPARLAAGVLGAVAALLARTPIALAVVVVLTGFGLYATHVSWLDIVRSWWRMSLILGLAFVGGAAGVGSRGQVLPLLGVVITRRGLLEGALSAAQIALAIASVRTFLLMGDARAIARALDWWLKPLRWIGLETRRVGEAIALTIEILPALAGELGDAVRTSGPRPRRLGAAIAGVVNRVAAAESLPLPSGPSTGVVGFSRRTGLPLVVLGVMAVATALMRV